jgi:anaerobic selenocysteine-containing dehydrogenase
MRRLVDLIAICWPLVLGCHPVLTYRTAEILKEPTERVWGYRYADLVMGCQMANPSELFRAMDTGDPYPIKAFFAFGNNALLSYQNQHQVHRWESRTLLDRT